MNDKYMRLPQYVAKDLYVKINHLGHCTFSEPITEIENFDLRRLAFISNQMSAQFFECTKNDYEEACDEKSND